MHLIVAKWERRDGADRDTFARAALNLCRLNRAQPGFRDSRFYWANVDTIAVVTSVEPGTPFGFGSGQGPNPDNAKAIFALSAVARAVSSETWGDAGGGEQSYNMSKK